ncbi:chloride channel CLIC-like protein 1 [Saccostrea echinata]|uniref:chloride channel CLIC-like protein 1 n=1 Tax=Saccostrea echinata TaxID=191078 RepID=UPI002A84035E|nr:chloride channel CLIC-like protein 1 [Saccostrea echinata]
MMLRICFLLLFCVVNVLTDEEYYDPFDMVNPRKIIKDKPDAEGTLHKTETRTSKEASSNELLPTEINEPINMKKEPMCPKVDAGKQIFKNFVQSFLKHFQLKEPTSGSQEYSMVLKLSVDDFKILRKFVKEESKDLHSLYDSNDILIGMIETVSRSHLGTMGQISIWFEDRYGASIDAALKMVAVLLMASVFATLEMKLQMSWRQRFMKLIVLAFIVSIPMTWFELYKAEQIKQQTVAMNDVPADCVKNDSISDNWFGAASHLVKTMFTLKEDKCQKYYEHIMIDPIVKVPPTKAVGVTFVRFFLSPLKDVGAALSTFIKELLIDLPITLYPVAMVMVVVFLFLFLFMIFGYSIKFPFFLSIEPSPYQGITGGTSHQLAIEENTKKLMEQIQTMQQTLQSKEEKFTARMNDFERLQKTAIEYSASINVPDVPYPTIPAGSIPKGAIASNITSSSQYTTQIFQESGDGDTLLVVETSEVKSPIPCSESDFESSVEDTTSKHVVDVPRTANSQSSPSGRSSKLPVSKRGKSGDHLPTPISSAGRTDIAQPQTLTPLSSESISPREVNSS